MPIVQISIVPQSFEKKAEMAKVITDEIHRITGIRKGAMVILFNELPPENAAQGGMMLSDKFKITEAQKNKS
jgi:4-oxalocrotonate tautomerase family enzyme